MPDNINGSETIDIFVKNRNSYRAKIDRNVTNQSIQCLHSKL